MADEKDEAKRRLWGESPPPESVRIASRAGGGQPHEPTEEARKFLEQWKKDMGGSDGGA